MRWRTFMIGWTMALAVLLIAHNAPAPGDNDVGTAVVELTYASSPQVPAAHQPLPASIGHPQRIVAPLVTLDVSAHSRLQPEYVVTMEDIAAWEDAHGHMPPNAVVMAHSNAATSWRGDSRRPAGNAGRFPGFSEDAIRFLVEARYAYGLGTETPASGRSVVLVYRGTN